MKALTTKQQHILNIIRDNPGCQDDEQKLLEAVWMADGWQEGKSLYWNLQRVTHAETVSRCRRFLHEHGYVKYSDEAETRRFQSYIEITNEHGERVMQVL